MPLLKSFSKSSQIIQLGTASFQFIKAICLKHKSVQFKTFSSKNALQEVSRSNLEFNPVNKYPNLLNKSVSDERDLTGFTTQILETTFADLSLPNIKKPLKGVKLYPHGHSIYFPVCLPESELGKDGYDQLFAPPSPPFLERVVTSGRLEFNLNNWLKIGQTVHLKSTCNNIAEGFSEKRGDSLSVEQKKVYSNEEGWSVTEFRTITYFHSKPNSNKTNLSNTKMLPRSALWTKTIHPTPILLFRYSAVTFNAHRIHYDPKYCQEVENYPDCLVHGPLICTLVLRFLCQVLETESRAWFDILKTFEYRLVRPLFVNNPFYIKITLNSNSADIWIEDNNCNLTFKGRARFSYS